MKVNPLAKVGNVMRAVIRQARDVILVNEEHGGVMTVADWQLLHIDDGPVGDASNAVEPGAAIAFQFRRPLGLATQQRIGAKDHGAATGNNQRIETQGNHTEKENKEDDNRRSPETPATFRYQHMTEASSAEVGGKLPRCQPVEILNAVVSVQWPVVSKRGPRRAFAFTGH